MQIKEKTIAGKTLRLETGRIARQSNGSVLVTYGETTVLATVNAAKEAREKVIADRKAEEQRKIAEKEAKENAEIDAAAEAAAQEAKRKLAAELGLELEGTTDTSLVEEMTVSSDTSLVEEEEVKSSPLEGFNFGLASSIGLASGEAFENVPVGGTLVISTPWGGKVGPLELTVSLGAGFYTGEYGGETFNPTFFGIGANGILAEFIFSETHLGLVGKGIGVRQFAGVTLERIMKKGLNLPFNFLVGGEGFISTDIDATGVTTGWGGLGVRLDINL